ncbi:hypothetical protein C0584_05935 [Candidatus Parcubacteria bacterium]|nr:MAG: hypothetical protein C0584_05935 [Candidatus Parcubacteria bacterium]
MKTVEELLRSNPTDKHFLVGTKVKIFPGQKKVEIYLRNDDELCVANEKVDPMLQNVPGLVSMGGANAARYSAAMSGGDDFAMHNILLSCGTILLLGTSLSTAYVPLLKRDPGAPSDANRLTTPAGRLDTLLGSGNYGELFEEMCLFGTNLGKDVIFAPKVPEGVSLSFDPNEKIMLSAKKGGVPNYEKREIVFMEHQPVGMDGLWQVDIYTDNVSAESCSNVYLCPDWENNTLEFRQVIMIDLPVEKGGMLEGIADGDGFGREVSVIAVDELEGFFKQVVNPSADLAAVFLKSNVDLIKVAATTLPAEGGVFGRFFWGAKQPGAFLVATVTDFVRNIVNR